MKDKSTVELRGRLSKVRKDLAVALEEAKIDGGGYDFSRATSLGGADADDNREKFQALDREGNDLGAELEERSGYDAAGERHTPATPIRPQHAADGGGRKDVEQKLSPGQAFVQSDGYKRFDPTQGGQHAGVGIDGLSFQAATFDTAGSTLTEYDRQPGIVLVGTQRLTVAQLFAQGQTSENTIRYPQEDTFTNAATAVLEGGTKPEASWDTSEVDAPVRKIAVTSKVTDEFFADFPAMASYIDNRMRFMVVLTEETQLLTGSGTAPNLRGVLNVVGIQTQAKGADNGPDAIMKGTVKVQVNGLYGDPDGIVMHPTDWQNIRLLKDANGNYIFGPPGMQVETRIWGYPVVVTVSMTLGTALVGMFKLGGQVFYREGMRVESTNSNEDDFKKNLIAIRAEQREAFAVYRPKAFCTVTGL